MIYRLVLLSMLLLLPTLQGCAESPAPTATPPGGAEVDTTGGGTGTSTEKPAPGGSDTK